MVEGVRSKVSRRAERWLNCILFYNCVSLYLVGYVLEGDECQGGAGKPHDRIEAWLKDEHKDKEIPLPGTRDARKLGKKSN